MKTTQDIKVPEKIVGQVIGQDEAVHIIKKAALQRRHVLLIGEPGTGKCVGKDTLISTTAGPIKAEELFNKLSGDKSVIRDETYATPNKKMLVHTLNKKGKITSRRIIRLYRGKRKKALKIITFSGAEVVISGDHPLLSVKDNQIQFLPSAELSTGAWVGLARRLEYQQTGGKDKNKEEYFQYIGKNGVKSLRIKVPQKIDQKLAYFLGVYVAEGRWQGNIKIYNQNKKIQQQIKSIVKDKFCYPEEQIELTPDYVYLRKSRSLIEILHQKYQIPIETTKQSSKKIIPTEIFTTTLEIAAAFVSGYIDGDGYVSKTRGVHCTSASRRLIEQLRFLLLRWGVQSRIKKQLKYASNTVKKRKATYFTLSVQDSVNIKKLQSILTLNIPYKAKNFDSYITKSQNTNVDIIPNVGPLLYQFKKEIKATYKDLNLYHATLDKIRKNERQASRNLVKSLTKRLREVADSKVNCVFPELKKLELLSKADVFWDRIKDISFVEEAMYDFEIKELHNYIVNGGLVVHNSMLGLALAELLPNSELKDTLAFPNPNDENKPLIKTVPAGTGREEVKKHQLDTKQVFKNNNFLLFIVAILTFIAPWWIRSHYKSDLMFTAFFLGGMLFLAAFAIMLSMGPRMFSQSKVVTPKVIVDNFGNKQAPFFDATGAHAGALLGDVLHDPFQSGGLGTPANQRVVAGMIHKAHRGVLLIDEIATLHPRTQQELLSALQEKKFPITGQSERSAGAMVRTEAVPCDFVLVAAGNLETIKNTHPALRSRIRGYGYEIYMNETMLDTKENRIKIARFVAQEVKREEGKIPHFDLTGINAIIEDAKRRANRKGHLTLHLRGLGGLVRAAGDLAKEKKAKYVTREHVKEAKKLARPLEQQIADKYIERKKEYEVIMIEGSRVGRVNGLAVIGGGSAYSGILLPIESEVTPGGKKSEIIATGKLGEIAKEAVKNVSAIIMHYFGEDIKETKDVFVQFLQTYEGVEGDSASIAVATAIISALKDIPVKQEVAMTGSLSVRGEVLPVGGVSSKVEAAIDTGIKIIIVPKSNLQDIVVDQAKLKQVKIIPVERIEEVLEHALDWGKKRKLKDIIVNGKKR
ncbi:MAG: ATP-dependent protease LonB [Nanoarchaeota archaeon]|nr:ATP-dependent protease LonB [Nanoarchaeota archaeon]